MTKGKLVLHVKERPKEGDPDEAAGEAVYEPKRGSGVTFGAVAQFVKKNFPIGKAPVSSIRFTDVEGNKVDLTTPVEVYADEWKDEDDDAQAYFHIHQPATPAPPPQSVPQSASKISGAKRAAAAGDSETELPAKTARYGDLKPPVGSGGGSNVKKKAAPSVAQLSSQLQTALGRVERGQRGMSSSSAAPTRPKGIASQATRGTARVLYQPATEDVISIESDEPEKHEVSTCPWCFADIVDVLELQCIVCKRYSQCGSLRGGYHLGLFVCCQDRTDVDQVRASNNTLLRIQGTHLQFDNVGADRGGGAGGVGGGVGGDGGGGGGGGGDGGGGRGDGDGGGSSITPAAGQRDTSASGEHPPEP